VAPAPGIRLNGLTIKEDEDDDDNTIIVEDD
jgi:hypothetical protein